MQANNTAFKQGYFAAKSGTVVGDNPYPATIDNEDHWNWMNGWTYFSLGDV